MTTYIRFTMKRFIVLIFCVIASLLSGCTKEDLSVCLDSTVTVVVDYIAPKSGDTELPFNRGEVYMFDKDGVLHSIHTLNSTKAIGNLLRGYSYNLENLEDGEYTLFLWGDMASEEVSPLSYKFSQSFEVGTTKISDVIVGANAANATSTSTTGPIENIYFGQIKFDYINQDINREYKLITKQLTKRIVVNTTFTYSNGNPATSYAENSEVEIEAQGTQLNLDAELIPSSGVVYLPYLSEVQDGGKLSARFRKLTIDIDGPKTMLRVVGKDNALLYEVDFIDLLKSTNYPTQEDVDVEIEFNVDIKIIVPDDEDMTHATVVITVNGWKYNNINQGV